MQVPQRPHFTFRPNPRQLEQITALAAEQSVTKSEILRNLIDKALASLQTTTEKER